jgi:hypothetical protein
MDGEVSVSLLGGFQPAPGNSFTVLTAGSINGTFGLDLPLISAGDVWNVGITGTALTLTVVAADYNHDGVVNAADFVLWRAAFGKSVTPFTSADGNGNGVVDQGDYTIWKNNFGETAGGSSGSGSGALANPGSVPEPASIVLLGWALVATFFAQVRRTSQS